MGSLMVRKKSGLQVAKKVGIVVVCAYIAMQVLPVIVGTGLFLGFIGVSLLVSLLSWTVYLGVPIAALALILGVLSSDD